ncbi:TPA: phosphoribosyltransferase [Streptococcus suis]
MIDLREEVPHADEAFALDWYKDDNGYTDIGSAVCDIKYGYIKNGVLSDEEKNQAIDYLVKKLMPSVDNCDVILPVPSFNPHHKDNPTGELKIMYIIADRLRKASGKNVDFSVLEKLSPNQAKTSQLKASDYRAYRLPNHVNRVLLIDDLFGKGNTANYCVDALKNTNTNVFVRFISLTKNKFGGIHTKFICSLLSDGIPKIAKNGNEFIILHFTFNGIDKKVWIWEDNSQYQEVKNAYINGEFGKTFEFYMYEKTNGYWQIDDD